MKIIISFFAAAVLSCALRAQDLVSGGSNSWLFHTPDDGRTTMHIAPLVSGSWNWSAQTIFYNDGRVDLSGPVVIFAQLYVKKAALVNDGQYPSDSPSLAVGDMQYGLNSAGGTLRILNTINDGGGFAFRTQTGGVFSDKVIITNAGNVAIGTTNSTHKLSVNGTIRAKEVIVDTNWADYVFAEDYRLAPLSEVEAHIKERKHLPGIPSAAQVAEQGVSMGEMQARMMAKIEELTLHMIELKKENVAQSDRLAAQAGRIERLEAENAILRNP